MNQPAWLSLIFSRIALSLSRVQCRVSFGTTPSAPNGHQLQQLKENEASVNLLY